MHFSRVFRISCTSRLPATPQPSLLRDRADSAKPNMGLTGWENGPGGKILRTDVTVGKNYLTAGELTELGRIVNAYLDLARTVLAGSSR